jgi:hypothetical protein
MTERRSCQIEQAGPITTQPRHDASLTSRSPPSRLASEVVTIATPKLWRSIRRRRDFSRPHGAGTAPQSDQSTSYSEIGCANGIRGEARDHGRVPSETGFHPQARAQYAFEGTAFGGSDVRAYAS